MRHLDTCELTGGHETCTCAERIYLASCDDDERSAEWWAENRPVRCGVVTQRGEVMTAQFSFTQCVMCQGPVWHDDEAPLCYWCRKDASK